MFGVYPKIPGASLRGSLAQRANVTRKCTKLVDNRNSRCILRESVRKRNTPSVPELEKVKNLSPGNQVFVFRERGGLTLYTLVRIHGNSVDVILPSELISTFSINVVRPYNTSDAGKDEKWNQEP